MFLYNETTEMGVKAEKLKTFISGTENSVGVDVVVDFDLLAIVVGNDRNFRVSKNTMEARKIVYWGY